MTATKQADPDITDLEIDALQAYAVADQPALWGLLCDTYEARGYGRRVPTLPTEGEVRNARARCAAARDALVTAPAPR